MGRKSKNRHNKYEMNKIYMKSSDAKNKI